MQNQEFNLQPSRQYAFLIIITVFTCLLIWVCLPLSFMVKIVGFVFLLMYGIHLFRNRNPISAIKFNGEWNIVRNNSWISAVLLGDSTVTSYVSILRFKIAGEKWPISCVIFRDALPKDKYRQLIVRVKC